MKTHFLFLLILFVGMGTIQAQDAMIEVQQDLHDFGTLDKGETASYTFMLKNTGFEPLILSKCQKTCGCTIPECSPDPILPGETGEVKVSYDSTRIGPFQKSVKVYSNAVNEPILVLRIKGKVEEKSGC